MDPEGREADPGHTDPHVREFLRGDARAVTRVEGLVARVVRFRGYYVPTEDQRDVVQEVLLEVWEALRKPGFAFTQGFPAFVRCMAHRRCVDWMRRRRDLVEVDPALPADGPAPDEALLQAERRGLAMSILAELPESCRELIRLHGEGTMTYRQIAERVGRSEAALRNQMYECIREARAALRRELLVRRTGASRHRSPL